MMRRTYSVIILDLLAAGVCRSQSTPAPLTGPEVAAPVKPSVALVLAGEGTSRLGATAF